MTKSNGTDNKKAKVKHKKAKIKPEEAKIELKKEEIRQKISALALEGYENGILLTEPKSRILPHPNYKKKYQAFEKLYSSEDGALNKLKEHKDEIISKLNGKILDDAELSEFLSHLTKLKTAINFFRNYNDNAKFKKLNSPKIIEDHAKNCDECKTFLQELIR